MNSSNADKKMNKGNLLNVNGTVLRLFLLALLAAAISPLPLFAADLPHHDITVMLDPGSHRLIARDTITLPSPVRETTFLLHEGLAPSSPDKGVGIRRVSSGQGGVTLERFRVSLPREGRTFTLIYTGRIYHPLTPSLNQARGFDQTPGSISTEGVYLAASSAWYPLLETDFLTFSLTVKLPAGWDAVSQGERTLHEKTKAAARTAWNSPEPQEEIYLIASRFIDYEKAGIVLAQVFLRSPDQALAQNYLDATMRYIAMYDKLIGPYPYKKFALVENFWETGFGMPSFTLLGPTVLRLPFIINTSYPHEILHNWWGNSVYPVYAKGNWSEGLTAYLADHLLKEQQGGGAEYRLNTLQKYADYVLAGRDFPLTEFTSRHNPSTEAVGYGKSLMFFHMLRLELGDEQFVAGLRRFYRDYKFRYATFDDIRKSLEAVSGRDLAAEFSEWVARTGAPELRLEQVAAEVRTEGGKSAYAVTGLLKQVQSEKPYRLRIPVAITLEGRDQAFQTIITITEAEHRFRIDVPSQPLRIDIDPEFDVFRRLDRKEIPPAISQALGAQKMVVVLPSVAGAALLRAYRSFAQSLAQAGPDRVTVKLDSEMASLPKDGSVAILGWENRFRETALALTRGYRVEVSNETVRIENTAVLKADHAFVLTTHGPGGDGQAILFIAADRAAALPGLARKLPHYHKYSFLAFEGDEPANVAKGRWPVVDSPLTAFLTEKGGSPVHIERAKLAPREALASLPPLYSEERMMETVRFLSSSALQGRETGSPGAEKAGEYIAAQFKQAGLAPGGDKGSFFQKGKDAATGLSIRNVIGIRPGKKPQTRESVVVGAHYDHLGLGNKIGRTQDRGKIHPGADDNASGVAVLLELGRVMNQAPPDDRAVVFVAFDGEEEGKIGSASYVRNEQAYPVKDCFAMVNLDTVGRLGTGKLLVLGGSSAREWPHIFRGAGFVTGVESEMVSQDLDSSDQKSFQDAGVPAVQLFSGPNIDYHRPTDTADKIDAAGLVKVASVAKETVEYLASRDQPLTSQLKPGSGQQSPKTERKVSLGTVPDFSYHGEGVRLSGVVEGSPAAKAGLREGDVITKINANPVKGLKDLSDQLKALHPEDRITVTYVRDTVERTVQTEVQAR
jgi:aminopeptidase N